MIKLSVSETKWSSLLASTRALILYISLWIFDFGPEKLLGLSRNGPLDGTYPSIFFKFGQLRTRKLQFLCRSVPSIVFTAGAVICSFTVLSSLFFRLIFISFEIRNCKLKFWGSHCIEYIGSALHDSSLFSMHIYIETSYLSDQVLINILLMLSI